MAENNRFQQRMQEQARAVQDAYAKLREEYENPTDEQILAVAGDNLRGYQRSINNKAGNWGTAFGSNALFGTLNKATRDALESGYQNNLNANKKTVSQKQNEVVGTYGNGNVTRGMQAKVRSWGDNIVDTDNITPEQVRALNAIMKANGFTEFAIPTTQVTTKNDKGEDVVTNVEQNISLSDLLNSMSPDEIDALDDLGFIDDDLNYLRPHNETFEEKLARKERERERIELAAQQQALERQRTRAGLADLVAGFGDMAKAAGGAMVTPRDYQAVYNSLTAQQQKNYDNYLLRMQAAKEAAKQKQREAEQRAYQEQLMDKQFAMQNEAARTAQEYKLQLEAAKAQYKQELAEANAREAMLRLEKKLAHDYTSDQLKKVTDGSSIYWNDTMHDIDKNKSNGTFGAIYGLLEQYLRGNEGFSSVLSGIEDPYGESTESKVRSIVARAVKDPSVMATVPTEVKQEIGRIISAAKGSPVKKVEGSATSNPPQNANGSIKKRYVNVANPNDIREWTDDEYNGLKQITKDQYKPA